MSFFPSSCLKRFLRHAPLLLITTSACLLLNACAIDDRTSQETRIPTQNTAIFIPKTDLDFFEASSLRCIRGDISDIDKIARTYSSSFFRNRKHQNQNKAVAPLLYQQIRPTLIFERCAQKARLLGNRTGIKHMLVKPAPIIRAARFFYAHNDPTTGAFWLQRLVNLKGEVLAYEMAGRNFIRKNKTLKIGVQLLEHSARLGNKDAKQILMSLMSPGSLYYQQITSNVNDKDKLKKNTKEETLFTEAYQRPDFTPTQSSHVPFQVISPTHPDMQTNFEERMQEIQKEHAARLNEVRAKAAKAAQEAETLLKAPD